ncbi:phage baseplate assembly protein V [Desulforamulus reducens MI-1]|uniref:Phage baseplate assembly protein V n=1 Tax=Desulforamulus reducens (strain ATCC BAA-1160 / DSM 100696 / MI-1) TaxID=349161 RepID=A4J3U8_DESRM|nr:phage baseplate assembly protein V [Desulforamulus reducens]ABO49751.1 phage baseplate assembly protein V [Desulforamulus reducens MI-1]
MDLIRVGQISSVNPEKCTARVMFQDKSDVVSYDLPVMVRGSLNNKDYWIPAPGEQVICLFLSSGVAQGFVLGSIYSEKDKPPVKDSNKRHISFSDGTKIEYDAATHTLTVNATGPVNIVAAGNVNVTGDVIADGISLKKHIHDGVMGGSSSTNPPVGGG